MDTAYVSIGDHKGCMKLIVVHIYTLYISCRLRSRGCTQIHGGGCGVVQDTQRSRCTIVTVLPSVYGHFGQFWGGCTLDTARPKCVILFADVTLLKGAVTSYVMSQHHTSVGHVTFYYKRSTDALVGGSCLLFIHSSGLTLSPETHVWLVPNTCKS